MKKTVLILSGMLLSLLLGAQELSGPLTLKECMDYAVQNNLSLQKDKLSAQGALQSKREVIGALLPQLSASAGFTENIDKTRITMPNFVNSMLPEAMRDPNAAKYMSVTMGTDMSANWGFSVSQQIFNYSLFNAVGIAKAAQEMADTGVAISTLDVQAQTATLFFNVQVLEYAVGEFDKSLSLMEHSQNMMGVFHENGIIRKVDLDQIKVAKSNLETEKLNMVLALDVQKKLLKLQMGMDVNAEIALPPLDLDQIESLVNRDSSKDFAIEDQLAFKLIKSQENMLVHQKNSAIGEALPALVLTGTYSQNYLGDEFKGPTYQHFPVSMVMLNLKVPIFTGLSKTAKVKKANIELQKAFKDEAQLGQSLTMAHSNAMAQLEQNRIVVASQRQNKDLAQEVMTVTESNYNEGMSSLSDLLNANSSLIQAQMNYVNALNKCIKAYIDLRKIEGNVQEINN